MNNNKEQYEAIVKKINATLNEYNNKEKECIKNGKKWEEFVKETRDIKEKLFTLDADARLIQEAGYEETKKWSDYTYTLEEFIEKSSSGELNNNDGTFYYALLGNNEGECTKTDVEIKPTDVLLDKIRQDFTHVILFKHNDIE